LAKLINCKGNLGPSEGKILEGTNNILVFGWIKKMNPIKLGEFCAGRTRRVGWFGTLHLSTM